ncbi:trefoil factor 2 [Alligator mississippiensis]|uniref:Trefoil factor 2 n=1 Tax=Alligator mississippiensis TaxID=8496 RepID=A0A151NRG2_ALLMI|nr:trefoil factor 2 [Alligator mississippiensis]
MACTTLDLIGRVHGMTLTVPTTKEDRLKLYPDISKAACQCKKASSNRTNCGPPGITPQQCLDRGCCFDSAVPNVPWCFRPPPKKYIDICVIEMAYRKNCGYPGISAEVCEKKGCCFDSAPPAVPWCFFPEKVEEGEKQCCVGSYDENTGSI